VNSFISRHGFMIVSALTLLSGVIIAINATFAVQDCSAKLRAYSTYSTSVRDLGKSAARSAAAVQLFEALPNTAPVPLAELLKQALVGLKYDTTEQPSQTTIAGWTVRKMEVAFPEAELARIGAFVIQAESQKPPWRLVSCKIRSSTPSGGSGFVSIGLEALEKTR